MIFSDSWLVFRWWGTLFLIGAAALPLTRRVFCAWYDRGYLFSKALGLVLVSWLVYVWGMARVAPFSVGTILIAVGVVFVVGLFSYTSLKSPKSLTWKTVVTEEIFFLAALLFWSWIKAHEPTIRSLEKFMDYGFMQSIGNSRYFPPPDMWYPPLSINYYYFGHLTTALLTKMSGLDLAYTFNLMLATIFALCFSMSFSIGVQLLRFGQVGKIGRIGQIGGGLFTAFLVTLAGNMQTIYAFTRGYSGDDVKPFWLLTWNVWELWQTGGMAEVVGKIGQGMQTYWYANATRFIPWTIHEFPSYSFAVSDVHGHVLSIPFVLLAIGMLILIFARKDHEVRTKKEEWVVLGLYGLLMGILLMTNALDGPIYFGLFSVLVLLRVGEAIDWKEKRKKIGIVLLTAAGASAPFLSHFKSFVNGVAVNCPLPFFANSKIGPILFEGVEKCQKSPAWMLWLLWGFFIFCGVAFFALGLRKIRRISDIRDLWRKKFTQIDTMLLVFFGFSMLLIIFPEFFYFKDIYPQHFRSNTMFKLGYQAFILCSIVSGYVIVRVLLMRRDDRTNRRQILTAKHKAPHFKTFFIALLIPQLFLVSIFPLFSVRSYFGGLRTYEGLYGLSWFAREYPENYGAMLWLNQELRTGNSGTNAMHEDSWVTLVEADGDSYTDYNHFSVFTGVPTIVGWAVHEWLWRGSYDAVSPRREEVRQIYELEDIQKTQAILGKYHVRYIIVGKLEREKFTNLQEEKFNSLGRLVYQNGGTEIYEVIDKPGKF